MSSSPRRDTLTDKYSSKIFFYIAEDYDSEEGSTEESGSDSEPEDTLQGERDATDSQASSSENDPPLLRDIEDNKGT